MCHPGADPQCLLSAFSASFSSEWTNPPWGLKPESGLCSLLFFFFNAPRSKVTITRAPVKYLASSELFFPPLSSSLLPNEPPSPRSPLPTSTSANCKCSLVAQAMRRSMAHRNDLYWKYLVPGRPQDKDQRASSWNHKIVVWGSGVQPYYCWTWVSCGNSWCMIREKQPDITAWLFTGTHSAYGMKSIYIFVVGSTVTTWLCSPLTSEESKWNRCSRS